MNYSCQSKVPYHVNAHTYQETNFHEKERGGICMETGFRLCILEIVIGRKPIKIKNCSLQRSALFSNISFSILVLFWACWFCIDGTAIRW